MGAKLTRAERGVYVQVVNSLRAGDRRFSEKLLKDFVRWIFAYVPSVSAASVDSKEFWDTVGEQLTRIARTGDSSVRKFFPLLILICKVITDKGKSSGSPVKPCPSSRYPATPLPRRSESVPCQRAQDTANPPDPPRSPLPPYRGGSDHPVPYLPLTLLPIPIYPVPSVPPAPVLTQNSAGTRDSRCLPGWQNHSRSSCLAMSGKVAMSSPDSPNSTPLPRRGSPPSSAPASKVVPASGPALSTRSPLSASMCVNPHFDDSVAPPFGASARSIGGSSPDHLSPPGSHSPLSCSHVPPCSSHGLGPGISGSTPDTAQTPVSHGPRFGSHANDTRREQAGARKARGEEEYRQGANPRWEPVPYACLRDLCKAANEFGRESSYFKGLLCATFYTHVRVPSDIKIVMRCLLPGVEFWIWERFWKRRLKNLLEVYKRDSLKAFITMDHLLGEGNFKKPQDQVLIIPPEVLEDIKGMAERALLCLPSRTAPSVEYIVIKQGAEENFIDFIDRLLQAMSKKVDDPETQKELLRSLAWVNANESCKRVLEALPPHPEPTIELMLETCVNVPPEKPPLPTPKMPSERFVKVVSTMAQEKKHRKCFNCASPSHFVKACPEKKTNTIDKYSYPGGAANHCTCHQLQGNCS